MSRIYTVNMIPGGVPRTVNVSQYDNDYNVEVTLLEGQGAYFIPAGATIRVEGTKPDGLGFEYDCTYASNVVQMPIKTQMSVIAGNFPIELVVYKSGVRVGSANMVLAVEKAPLGEGTDISETVIPDIIDAAETNAERAEDAADRAEASAEEVEETAIDLAPVIVSNASGSIASFPDGTDRDATRVVVNIIPSQSGSGAPSPTNVRPISGYTSVDVVVSNQDSSESSTTTISLPSTAGTVYGGTLDVTNGTLTVDRAALDLGTMSWTLSARGYFDGYLAAVSDTIKRPESGSQLVGIISSQYTEDTSNQIYNTAPNGKIAVRNTNGDIWIVDNRYSTAASFKTAMSGVTAVYYLATPVVYTLTPEQIKTLQGYNNIYSPQGSVSVDYRADTKLYIEKLTKPTEDDMIANTNIASGKFFMVGNNLYISTTAITTGTTIAPGTNCTALSLADALNQINA